MSSTPQKMGKAVPGSQLSTGVFPVPQWGGPSWVRAVGGVPVCGDTTLLFWSWFLLGLEVPRNSGERVETGGQLL